MKSYDEMEYFDLSETLVETICQKVQNHNKEFFRLQVAYHFVKMASSMNCRVKTINQVLPVNM